MTRRTAVLSFAVVLAVGGLDACRKKPEPDPVPAASPATDPNAQRRADSIAAANLATRRRADSIAAADAAAAAAKAGDETKRTSAELAQILAQKVYFDYDKDVLRDDARAVLDAKAPILIANGWVSLSVTGHTDERGTAEYNLALGQRRAAQVKRYLESKGVPENRMSTQSMGDSQPVAQGTDEASYQQNRRAEFEFPANGGALVRPKS
ncbi:MAG: OmpA family protein [bacterium]